MRGCGHVAACKGGALRSGSGWWHGWRVMGTGPTEPVGWVVRCSAAARPSRPPICCVRAAGRCRGGAAPAASCVTCLPRSWAGASSAAGGGTAPGKRPSRWCCMVVAAVSWASHMCLQATRLCCPAALWCCATACGGRPCLPAAPHAGKMLRRRWICTSSTSTLSGGERIGSRAQRVAEGALEQQASQHAPATLAPQLVSH